MSFPVVNKIIILIFSTVLVLHANSFYLSLNSISHIKRYINRTSPLYLQEYPESCQEKVNFSNSSTIIFLNVLDSCSFDSNHSQEDMKLFFGGVIQASLGNEEEALNTWSAKRDSVSQYLAYLAELNVNNRAFSQDLAYYSSQLRPTSVESAISTSQTLFRIRYFDHAEFILRSALQDNQDDLLLILLHGQAQMAMGNYHGAIKSCEKILTQEKLFLESTNCIGRASYFAQEWDFGENTLQKAYKAKITDETTLMWLAKIYIASEKTEKAKSLILGEEEKWSTIPLVGNHILFDLAGIYCTEGNIKEADSRYKQLFQSNPIFLSEQNLNRRC